MEKKKSSKNDDKSLPIFAKTLIQVGTTGIDYYTFGHILMGLIGFPILLNLFLPPDAFSFLQFSALIWELFENVILFKAGLKFEGRRDSGLNAIFDIAFVNIGGLISYFFYHLFCETQGFHYNLYMAILLIISSIVIILFIGFRKKVINYSLNKRFEKLTGYDEELKENFYLAQIYSELLEEKLENVKKKVKSKKIDIDLL